MRASSLSFKTAVLCAIAGMLMGIAMAASHDHSVMNLLSWVSLFLFGTYYRSDPAMDASRLALIQAGVWIVGTGVLTIGVAALHLGYTFGEPTAIAGSCIVLADIMLFAVLIFRPVRLRSRNDGARAARVGP